MLNCKQSKRIQTWRYSLVIPFLILFILNVNTVAQAQSTSTVKSSVDDTQNNLTFIITEHIKDEQLDKIVKTLKEKGAVITIKNVHRNNRDEIVSIKLKYASDTGKGTLYNKTTRPIKPFMIHFNTTTKKITIEKELKIDVIVIDEDSEDVGHREKSIHEPNNNDGLLNNQPLYLLNGKEISFEIMQNIDPSTILSVEVIKDEHKLKKYGEKGIKGAVLIITDTSKK